jgi:hypothetical protein
MFKQGKRQRHLRPHIQAPGFTKALFDPRKETASHSDLRHLCSGKGTFPDACALANSGFASRIPATGAGRQSTGHGLAAHGRDTANRAGWKAPLGVASSRLPRRPHFSKVLLRQALDRLAQGKGLIKVGRYLGARVSDAFAPGDSARGIVDNEQAFFAKPARPLPARRGQNLHRARAIQIVAAQKAPTGCTSNTKNPVRQAIAPRRRVLSLTTSLKRDSHGDMARPA